MMALAPRAWFSARALLPFTSTPAGEDYFSVTGGDFTVEASGKGSFRVNNFDDGSNVEVLTRPCLCPSQKRYDLAPQRTVAFHEGGRGLRHRRCPFRSAIVRSLGLQPHRHRLQRNGRLSPVHQLRLLRARLCRSLHLRRLELLRFLWLWLAAFRCRPGLVSVHLRRLVLGSRFRLDFCQLPALGLGSLSLWRLAL